MEQNMTALVSLFARAYHQKNKDIKIFKRTFVLMNIKIHKNICLFIF